MKKEHWMHKKMNKKVVGTRVSGAFIAFYRWVFGIQPAVIPKIIKEPPEPAISQPDDEDLLEAVELGMDGVDQGLLHINASNIEVNRLIRQLDKEGREAGYEKGCLVWFAACMAGCSSYIREKSPKWNVVILVGAAIGSGIGISYLLNQTIEGLVLGSNIQSNNQLLYNETENLRYWTRKVNPVISLAISAGTSIGTSLIAYFTLRRVIARFEEVVNESRNRTLACEIRITKSLIPEHLRERDLLAALIPLVERLQAEVIQHREEIARLKGGVPPVSASQVKSAETKNRGVGFGSKTDKAIVLKSNQLRPVTARVNSKVSDLAKPKQALQLAEQKKREETSSASKSVTAGTSKKVAEFRAKKTS